MRFQTGAHCRILLGMNRQTLHLLPTLAALFIFCASNTRADSPTPTLPMMPLPAQAQVGTGSFVIDGGFAIKSSGYSEPRLERAEQRFLDRLTTKSGIQFHPQPPGTTPHFFIQTTGPSKPVQQLGEDESYTLTVTAQDVHLSAANPLGILHGLQSFLQLVHTSTGGQVVDAVTIQDQPRFPWRGLMIDSGRHFTTTCHHQDQPRRHGSCEAECLPLAPVGGPGLSHAEQALSAAYRERFGWPLLHAGRDSRHRRVTRMIAASA